MKKLTMFFVGIFLFLVSLFLPSQDENETPKQTESEEDDDYETWLFI